MTIRLVASPNVGLWAPLGPDATTYGIIARRILEQGLTVPLGVLVPFWPVVIASSFTLFGVSDITQKFTSFFFGILTIFMTYKVAREAFDYRVGVLASFLLVTSYYVLFNAFQGLREPLFSFLLLCFIYFALIREGDDTVNLAMSAVLTAMLYFTRTDGTFVVIPTLLLYLVISSLARKGKIPVRKLLVITVTFALSIAGWALYSASVFGDPFAETTNYASWLYWVDCLKSVGPMPSGVTMTEYLFKCHR